LWKACDDLGIYGVFTKVLLLTGQRLRKVAYMRHDELSADGVWPVREESKREKGNVGKVKLPQMTIDLIRSLSPIEGNPHVFPATYGGGPINGFGVWKQRLDKHLPPAMRPWVAHDLRRTARKLMTRAGVRPDVAELALGHSIKGIQSVYDDPVEYRPLIERALECVANEVDKILNPPPPNVIEMKKGKRATTNTHGNPAAR
jgi:integrase